MEHKPERGGALRRMTALRHFLSCLLVIVGIADIRAVSAAAAAIEPWSVGHSAIATLPLAPCTDGVAGGVIEVAAPAEFLPDLLPPERDGEVIVNTPSGAVTGVRYAEARNVPVHHIGARPPIHGFSSRAPPLSC